MLSMVIVWGNGAFIMPMHLLFASPDSIAVSLEMPRKVIPSHVIGHETSSTYKPASTPTTSPVPALSRPFWIVLKGLA